MKEAVSGCPLEETMRVLGGRWRIVLVYYLLEGKKRFSELRKLNLDPLLMHWSKHLIHLL